MNLIQKNHVAVIQDEGVLISTLQDALDLIATVSHETDCTAVVLPKEAVAEDFFHLSTGLAGEVLQKFVNYQMRLAIIGDYSGYSSMSFRDFVRESNQGQHILFVDTEEEAVSRLGG